jgi:3-dehydroquinate synthetase
MGWTDVVTAISTSILATLSVGLLLAFILWLRDAKRLMESVERVVISLDRDARPALESARGIIDDAGKVMTTIREEVDGFADVSRDVRGRVADLAESVEERLEDLETVVERAIRVKARYVETDLRERGERIYLNYGHTVGHAYEVAARLTHGHAVAVGMGVAGVLATDLLGFAGARLQRNLLEALGVPTSAPAVPWSTLARLISRDKKRTGGEVRMVLLEAVGRPRVVEVDGDDLRAAIERYTDRS